MDTLKDEWIYNCVRLASRPADWWSRSSRKILRQRKITYEHWDDSLQLEDLGFTKKKLHDLERNYLHPESRAVAVELWDRQRQKAKHGSVSFTTFNHLVKGGDTVEEVEASRSGIASVQGPCIRSVVITWLAKDEVAVDVFYRSTELFKKFGADLIFIRDVLLTPFDFSGMEVTVTGHFANVTLHPGYWVTILAHVDDPIACIEEVRRNDPAFHRQLVKHTAEYLCPECGSSIANHAQSQRVKEHALKAIRGAGCACCKGTCGNSLVALADDMGGEPRPGRNDVAAPRSAQGPFDRLAMWAQRAALLLERGVRRCCRAPERRLHERARTKPQRLIWNVLIGGWYVVCET